MDFKLIVNFFVFVIPVLGDSGSEQAGNGHPVSRSSTGEASGHLSSGQVPGFSALDGTSTDADISFPGSEQFTAQHCQEEKVAHPVKSRMFFPGIIMNHSTVAGHCFSAGSPLDSSQLLSLSKASLPMEGSVGTDEDKDRAGTVIADGLVTVVEYPSVVIRETPHSDALQLDNSPLGQSSTAYGTRMSPTGERLISTNKTALSAEENGEELSHIVSPRQVSAARAGSESNVVRSHKPPPAATEEEELDGGQEDHLTSCVQSAVRTELARVWMVREQSYHINCGAWLCVHKCVFVSMTLSSCLRMVILVQQAQHMQLLSHIDPSALAGVTSLPWQPTTLAPG